MKSVRPITVLVMAILSTIFGVFFLLGAVWSTFSAVLMYGINIQGASPITGILVDIPGYVPFLFATALFDLVFSVLLLITGIGLFAMKRFARRTAIIFGVAVIVRQVASVLIQALYVNPAMSQVFAQQGAPAGLGFFTGPLLLNLQALMYAFFPTVYAAALLVVMFLPGVRNAFANPQTVPDEDPEDATGHN
jgi:hypothetical protein